MFQKVENFRSDRQAAGERDRARTGVRNEKQREGKEQTHLLGKDMKKGRGEKS